MYNIAEINYKFDVSNLDYSKNLENIQIYSDKAKGDVSNLFKEVDTSRLDNPFLVLYSRSGSSVGNTGLYGDITEVVNRLAKSPNGLRYLNLGVANVYGTIKGVVSSNYVFGDFCGDVTLDLSGLDFSGKSVKVSSSSAINSKLKLTGDISSLKSAESVVLILATCGEKCEISGDIIDAINGKYRGETLKLARVKNATVQDFSKLNNVNSLKLISNQYAEDDWHIPFTWTKNGYQGQYIIALETVYMQSHTEDMLVDMATKSLNPAATKTYEKAMSIRALDLSGATENITTAVNTLTGKGITVSITYLGGSNGISLMSAKTANKYAIVYKGKELIVEPADTSKTLIAPANDCTYKEFNSLEEVQKFILSNGLVKVESK